MRHRNKKKGEIDTSYKKNIRISSQMIDFTIRKSIKEKGEEKKYSNPFVFSIHFC